MDFPHRPVAVRWLDSGMHIDKGWASLEDYRKDTSTQRMTVVTVGILMHEDEETLLIGQSFDPAHDHWVGGQLIVKENIIDRNWLTRPDGTSEEWAPRG